MLAQRNVARQASKRPASARSSRSVSPTLAAPARTLFGTDGVRGRVGERLTAELALSIGRAGTEALSGERAPQVLIVRDTRESGPMLEAALAAGVSEAGGDVFTAGVLPTPAAAILTRKYNFDLAAVVSASHNPYWDNGIKLFGKGGDKLDDETEARIEALIREPQAPAAKPGHIEELRGAEADYLRALQSYFEIDLSGLKVCLDCANGATYRVAGEIYRRLGAEVDVIADTPDGRNINEACGSTDLTALIERVRSTDATIGFAYDGDGDRLLAVDGNGDVHDGDELIALAAIDRHRRGTLGGGVAVTVMTNYGFHLALGGAGIDVAVTNVGDRYVLESLKEKGWTLGGEQSGHIISTDYAPTGDGIAASLMVLRALEGQDLAGAKVMERLPQTLVNVAVADREAIAGATTLWDAVDAANAELEGHGRVLVRASGTEPLVRVMVEAPTQAEAESVCDSLVELVKADLG